MTNELMLYLMGYLNTHLFPKKKENKSFPKAVYGIYMPLDISREIKYPSYSK